MSDVTKRTAARMAPELERLIEAHLNAGMILGSTQHVELEEFLWDHKVGILCVLQDHARCRDIKTEQGGGP